MPVTSQSVIAQRSYRRTVISVAEQHSISHHFHGTEDDENCAFPEFQQASGEKGTSHQIRFQDRVFDGPTANDNVSGQEESGTWLTDTISMELLHWTGKVEEVWSESQLTSVDLRASEFDRIGKNIAETWDRWAFRQLAGTVRYNSEPRYRKTGGNPVTAHDSAHIKYAPYGGANTTTANVAADTNAVVTGSMINHLEMISQTKDYLGYRIPPCETPWGMYYVFIVDAEGYSQILSSTPDAAITNLNLALIQGGQDPDKNPMRLSQPFLYRSTIVLRSDYIEAADNAGGTAAQPNTKVGLFFGARCLGRMYGSQFRVNGHVKYLEKWDYSRIGIRASTIAGYKRLIPQPEAPGDTAKTFSSIAVVYRTGV